MARRENCGGPAAGLFQIHLGQMKMLTPATTDPDKGAPAHSTVVQDASVAPRARFDRNTKIPGYVLVEPLGQGAYGQVWQAVRVGTGQDVALKIFTAPGRLDWRYLQREVDRLMRVAEHPHIVTLLDANLQNDPPFYTMTLLRRGSLADLCREGRPMADVRRASHWFEQMAAALEFAHSKSLLHCDLKPANVLLDEEDSARVVDFGQSQLRGEAAMALGTLAYMAPEQAVVCDEHAVPPDPSVGWDIYGLGATLYAVLTGQAPYMRGDLHMTLSHLESVGARLAEYRRVVTSRPLIPIRRINPAVDADFAAIVEHCLEPDPARRYRHMGEVSADLRRWRAGRPLACRPRRPTYLLGKFVRRNLGMVLISITALIALMTMFLTMTIRLEDQRLQLESEKSELQTKLELLQRQLERPPETFDDPAPPGVGPQ
jgi:serine/threonine protein kinase